MDLSLGDSLDPAGMVLVPCGRDGISWLTSERKRTPSGVLYPCSPDRSTRPLGKSGWLFSGAFDVGALGVSGDTQNTDWLRYRNYDDSGVGRLSLQLERPEDGRYLDVRGSFLNPDQQYYKGLYGQAGHFKLEGYFRRGSNVTAGRANSIWDGVGTQHLTLRSGLTPAGSSQAAVVAASVDAPTLRLEVVRSKEGFGFNYYLARKTTAYATVTHEARKGARPFGGPFFFGFIAPGIGGVYETPRPIDDSTINTNGGVRHTGKVWNWEAGYSGSFFRNGMRTFDYEVPFALASLVPGVGNAPLTLGEFAYEPNNDYHSLRARVTRKFSQTSQLSLDASYSTSRQDDQLAAPMNCTGEFGLTMPGLMFNCADWNTTDALSQTTANLSINSALVNARIVARPRKSVTVQGNVKFHRQDYDGLYTAYNQLTGQYGFISENGAQGSTVPFEMGVWDPVLFPDVLTRVRSLPLDKDILEASAGADWRLTPKQSLGVIGTFTRITRTNREVEHQDDRFVKVTWSTRAIDDLTLRANYSYLNRVGHDYEYDPYEFTFSKSLAGYVEPANPFHHTVEEMRKYDVGGRRQHKVTLIATFALPKSMTLSGTARGDWNDYGAEIGRQGYDSYGGTVQWDWQPDERVGASAFFGVDRSRLDMANVNDLAAPGALATLGGDTYPLENVWWVEDLQRNFYGGGELRYAFRRGQVDASWNYSDSRGLTDYTFASPGALAYPDLATAAGTGFPAMLYRVNSVAASYTIPIKKHISVRIFGLHETGRLFDWHYSGLENGLVTNSRVYLNPGPQDYSAQLFGVRLVVKL